MYFLTESSFYCAQIRENGNGLNVVILTKDKLLPDSNGCPVDEGDGEEARPEGGEDGVPRVVRIHSCVTERNKGTSSLDF
jgi:hypothetical protein